MTRNTASRRSGFTLIELLVVIAIIAILTGMLLAGVMRVKDAGYRTQAKDEMAQLQSSIGTFSTTMNHAHIPSRMMLKERGDYNMSDPLERDTLLLLKKMFPNAYLHQPMDWSGLGQRNQNYYLEGWQCLVFCLGGLPRQQNGLVGMAGFSSNPIDPTNFVNASNPSVPHKPIGPFYNFPPKRLNVTVATRFPTAPASNAIFPGYDDPWGTPYAFFSSHGDKTLSSTGYYRHGDPRVTGKVSDCASLGLWPYFESTTPVAGGVTKFHNPTSFQIISAGKDRLFGAGGQWPGLTPNGSDDMSNFTTAIMGAGR